MFDDGMTRSLSHVAPCVFSTFTTENRTHDNSGTFMVGGCSMYMSDSNQHTTPTMLDTLYTSYTYFLRLLPSNIEKEKLQAKLDTKVRTAGRKTTRNLAITFISEQVSVRLRRKLINIGSTFILSS